MHRKLLFLCLFLPSGVLAGLNNIISQDITNPQQVSTINTNIESLFRGKLDMRPGHTIPREPDKYDLGSEDYPWNEIFVNEIIASGRPWVDITAYGAVPNDGLEDSTAINAAIAANGSGFNYYAPAGRYDINGPILSRSSTTFFGDGMGVTIFRLMDNVMPGAGADGGRIFSNANWTVVGSSDINIAVYNLTVHGNYANNTDVGIGSAAGLSFGYATNVRLCYLEITDVNGYGAIYIGNTISGPETYNRGFLIAHNDIRNSTTTSSSGSYGAMMFLSAPQSGRGVVTGNYGYDNRQGLLLEDSPSFVAVTNNLIEKSTYSTVGSGMLINAGVALNGLQSRSDLISGNIVRHYGSGFVISGSTNTSHSLMGNYADACYNSGFEFSTGGSATDLIKEMSVIGNHAYNTRAGPGFHAGSGARNIIFMANHAHDNQTTKTQTYGFSSDATTSSMTIIANDFTNNLTGPISLAGNNHGVVFNRGYTTDQFASHDFYVGTVHQQGLKLRDDGANSTITSGSGRGTGNLTIQASGGSTAITIGQTGGIQIGAPTGGDLGNFNVNISSDLYQNNSKFNNPDYVFEKYYTGKIEKYRESEGARFYNGPVSLDLNRDFTKQFHHLPGVPMKWGIFGRTDILLEKLEEAYIYIYQLDDRIKQLEAGKNHGGQ